MGATGMQLSDIHLMAYTAKIAQPVHVLGCLLTALNNVLLPTLFNVANNIV